MDISVPNGKYVLAVSGGVDSMVLLDVMSRQSGLDLVVAHFDHGIRPDSYVDCELVKEAAARYGLPFVSGKGNLGPFASEAVAREARYAFLRQVKSEQGASAIITAHHEDDMLETAILNIMRGTGRKGLSAIATSGDVMRPLLQVSKEDIIAYAHEHSNIRWREDATNSDERYLRNYIRQRFIGRLGEQGRELLLEYIASAAQANPLIDTLLLQDIQEHTDQDGLERSWFIMLPHDVSCEVMATWLREQGIREFDRKLIQRLVVAAKTALPGKHSDINAAYWLKVAKARLQVVGRGVS